MSRSNNRKKVVVTGLGPITSVGIGADALWQSLFEGKTDIVEHKHILSGELIDTFPLHMIQSFNLDDFKIPENGLKSIRDWKKDAIDRELSLFLASIKVALDDSKIKNSYRKDIGFVFTQEMPGVEDFFEKVIIKTINFSRTGKKMTHKNVSEYLYEACEAQGYDLQTFMYIYFALKCFGCHGYSLFINNACASGSYAIEEAARIIRSGHQKIIIVSGGDSPIKSFKYNWFKKRGLYSSDGLVRPFCRNSNGIVFGEGVSSLVLEDFDHAKKREAKIYAEYLGGGFSQEAWKVTLPNITENFYLSAFQKGLKESKVDISEIDFVNAHGVGIKITDNYEARTIKKVFSRLKNKPLVTAFKPYIGHNLGGSSLIESVISILCLKNNCILPTLNTEDYDENLGINLAREKVEKDLRIFAKMSCGFAGFNSVIFFRK
ncbi:MAG TPA: beta-ketoacyl synthase N-terminal-like domain-containing protein [Candidatus Omnitrophota bacterium]|nr:beta-ketoacyl synthase N-terminal-like domain-containing protein [Candidatus Omnitrophota bacterium]